VSGKPLTWENAQEADVLRSRVRRFESCRGHFASTSVIKPLTCKSAKYKEPDSVPLGPALCHPLSLLACE
jgi:hypothetical protein